VEVKRSGVNGVNVSDFKSGHGLFESLPSSPRAFLDFVNTHWDRVLHVAFVFQIQPLNPESRPFLVFVQPGADGKAREQYARLLQELKEICGRERITIGGFATDGDSGHD
jgi:hypothetical protein